MDPNGWIAVYGCSVASTEARQAGLQQLANDIRVGVYGSTEKLCFPDYSPYPVPTDLHNAEGLWVPILSLNYLEPIPELVST